MTCVTAAIPGETIQCYQVQGFAAILEGTARVIISLRTLWWHRRARPAGLGRTERITGVARYNRAGESMIR